MEKTVAKLNNMRALACTGVEGNAWMPPATQSVIRLIQGYNYGKTCLPEGETEGLSSCGNSLSDYKSRESCRFMSVTYSQLTITWQGYANVGDGVRV